MPLRPPVALALVLATLPAGAQRAPAAPPPPRSFGPDRVATGVFTGAGVTAPGLECDAPNQPAVPLTCRGYLASAVDGTLLETTVRVPRDEGLHPLVVVMHGWGGGASSSQRYDDRFTAAGYTVLRYGARGFGGSWGQTNLADVDVEGADLRSVLGQVADDPRLAVDPSVVGVFGASYGGAHAWLAAREPQFRSPGGKEVAIRAIVPIAAWSDLLNALVPNGRPEAAHAVAGAEKLSYVQGFFAGGLRLRADRPYLNYPEYLLRWNLELTANERPYTANAAAREVADGLQGYRSAYWQHRLFERVAAQATARTGQLPILLVQGWTDDLFPADEALRMYDALRALDPDYPVAVYLGDIGHPRAANKAGEVARLLDEVIRWFGWWLQAEGEAPALDVQAAITRPREVPFDPADVLRAPTPAALSTALATAAPGGARIITFDPLDTSGFRWDPLVLQACSELDPCPAPPDLRLPGSVAAWTVPVAALSGGGPLLVAGAPLLSVTASTFAHRVQLDVRLIDVAPDGTRALVTRGTFTVDTGSPASPIGIRRVRIPTFGNLWELPADHALRIEVANVDLPYLRPSLVPSVTVLSGVRLAVPHRPRAPGVAAAR